MAECENPENLALVLYQQRLKYCSSEAYMARRLSFQKLLLGLALATLAMDSPTAYAQNTPAVSPPADKPTKDKADDKEHRDGKHDDRRDGDRRDGDRRDGRDGGRGLGGIIAMMAGNPEFLLEVCKRDGGPVELLPALMKPEVRKEMGLDPQHATAADKFLADMTKRFTDELNALKQQPNPNLREMFEKRLKAENEEFEKLLASLPVEKRERLIGIFVQYRNLRAVSNRVIAIEKLGMTSEQADKLRKDIHQIRMETFREMDDRVRDEVIERGTVQPPNLRKVRDNIDTRIKKLLTKEQLEKLQALRGPELSPELIEQLDRPPTPPSPPPKK